MNRDLKRAALVARIELLTAHQENVSDSDGVRRAIDRDEAELRQLQQSQEPR
jgi:hypothetical protein